MMPRIDAAQKQTIRSTELMQVKETEEAFYVWNFGTSAS
jgi:hypothetical protein